MSAIRKSAQITKECVACGTCLKYCPRGAISIYHGMHAQVDDSRCVGCGLCAKACPAGTIQILEKETAK